MNRAALLLCGLPLLAACTADTLVLEGSGRACERATECEEGEICAFEGPGCQIQGVCTTYQCDDRDTFEVLCACRGDRVFGDAICAPDRYTRVQTNATPCEGVVLPRDGGPSTTVCSTTNDCATGFICEYTPGSCGELGECRQQSTCSGDAGVAQICGCDGVTTQGATFCLEQPFEMFGACPGQRDGGPDAGVDRDGGPRDGGPRDGGPISCADTTDCGAGEICEFTEGSCGQLGTCREQISCMGDAAVAQICDCNGNTIQGATFCVEQPFQMFGACPGQRDAGP